jgi:hypothetical protein
MWPALLAGIVSLTAMFGVPTRATAQITGSAECCLELLFRIGARSLGLGEAITARRDAASLFINPALIADLDSDQFMVHSSQSSVDDSNTFSLLIRSELIGSLGLTYRMVNYGEIPVTGPDPTQPPLGTLDLFAQVVTATYATRVLPGLAAGVNYQLFQFRQACRGNCQEQDLAATTHSIDAGVHYVPARLPMLNLGAALVHAGFPLQFRNAEQADPLPLRARIGAAYEVAHHLRRDTTVTWWLSTDVVVSPRDGRVQLNVGSEVSLEQTLFLYAGYGGGEGVIGGAAAGAGLRYGRFDVRIAKSFFASPLEQTEPVQITFGIRF